MAGAKKSHDSDPDPDAIPAPDAILLSTVRQAADLYAAGLSLARIAEEMQTEDNRMNPLKVRKLLITGMAQGLCLYRSERAEAVLALHSAGAGIEAIMAQLGLSRASVYSYIPYRRVLYTRAGSAEASAAAERIRLYRQRRQAVEALQAAVQLPEPVYVTPPGRPGTQLELWDDAGVSTAVLALWAAVVAFQHYPFRTVSGLPFTYTLKTGRDGAYTRELLIDRRENSKPLAWSSVLLAFAAAQQKQGRLLARPKELGDIRGVSYIYPMFWRFGLLCVPEDAAARMQVRQQRAVQQHRQHRQR